MLRALHWSSVCSGLYAVSQQYRIYQIQIMCMSRIWRSRLDLSLSIFPLDPHISPVSSNIYHLCLIFSAITGNIWDALPAGHAWPVWYLGSTQWISIILKLLGRLHNVWAIVVVHHLVIYLLFLWVLLYVWK